MNAILNEIKIKTIFEERIELNDDERSAELELIEKLSKYSSSSFLNSVWVLDKNHNKIENERISFKVIINADKIYVDLIKLFILILLERGKKSFNTLTYDFKLLYIFMEVNKINLLQFNISTFAVFENWLIRNNKINDNTRTRIYQSVQNFFHIMYGHSKIAKINGVKNLENPFKSLDSDFYREIEENILFKYDKYFKNVNLTLHHRIVYWLLRLYGVRPCDLSNYPLICVRKLSDDIGTIKHAIVKNARGSTGIDYKIEYLNLKEEYQRMLFNLIKKQQIISSKLQDNVLKKDFLFTFDFKNTTLLLDAQKIRRIIRNAGINLNIQKNKRARPRDFKKTAITLRAKSGWTSEQLKIFANHSSFDSINAYSKPSEKFLIEQQRNILVSEKRISDAYVFKGKILNNINKALETKLLSNFRAHKIPDLGYCPNVSSCGNHFECLDCDYLLPDYDLKDYYLEQVDRYFEIAEKQNTLDDITNARDSLHRATLFANLYNKVNKK